MSKYTTEVRFICETLAGYEESQGQKKIAEIIEAARPKIFDFDYDLFDADYKPVIETKILNHYYLSEIGMETVGVWKHFLQMKMNEIMPYYSKLYESAALEFDPFHDVDYYREHQGSGSGETSGTTTSNGKNNTTGWDYYSDTPQGSITRLEDLTYLTDARHTTGESSDITTSTNTGNVTNTDQYLDHIYGKMGASDYSKLLENYRGTLLNIDLMVINELSDLFMNLW